MKLLKMGKYLGIILVLSLLIVAIPASPVMAGALLLSPASGQIGASITVTGSAFAPTTDPLNPQYAILYFSNQAATIGQIIGTNVTKYKTIANQVTTSGGTFTISIQIPAKYNDSSDVSSGTHYLYAAHHLTPSFIEAVATLTIVGGDISLSPLMGTVDSPVVITGDSFAASQAISITFGGTAVPIETGSTTTDTAGDFSSTILVPESKAGVHDIVVTISGYAVTAQFTVEPDVVIFPQSGAPGDSITISGTGFARRPKLVDIYFNNTFIQSMQTDTNGSFYLPAFEIPELGLTQGTYNIEVEDEDENLAVIAFTLNVTTPTTTPPTTTPPTTTPPDTTGLNLYSSGNLVGSIIVIRGTGFTPNSTVEFIYDGVKVEEATTTWDSTGTFTAQFPAPPSSGGDHIITVTDGTNTNQITYTVESTPPLNPPLQVPRMGEKVKTPVLFDWDDVTDASSPVSYTLQISSDITFSDIVLEKTALAVSNFTLTEQEEASFTGQDTPYYWRVMAVDAALNEGTWSGPGEFYISPPFSFPTWAIITLAIVGGILLFGVGYWLGRRTAFFY